MDVSYGSSGTSLLSGNAGADHAHRLGPDGDFGQAASGSSPRFVIADYQSAPSLREGLDRYLVGQGLRPGTTGKPGVIGGADICSHQALAMLPIEFWSEREARLVGDLAQYASTQPFADKFGLAPLSLSTAELARLKDSHERTGASTFDPTSAAAAARSLSGELSSERQQPAADGLFSPAEEDAPGGGEDGEGGTEAPVDPSSPASGTPSARPQDRDAYDTILRTSRPAQIGPPRPGSVAKSVMDSQAVAVIHNKATQALQRMQHEWGETMQALDAATALDAVVTRQPPLVNAELTAHIRAQERGLGLIRIAADGYCATGASSGPSLVSALDPHAIDWTFANLIASFSGEVRLSHLERVYGLVPIVPLAMLVVEKYFTPPGMAPTLQALYQGVDAMDLTGDSGVADSVPALVRLLGRVQHARLVLNPDKLLKKLIVKMTDAETVDIKEGHLDWSLFVRRVSEAAVARGDAPATEAELQAIRAQLVEFAAAQARRVDIRLHVRGGALGGARPGSGVVAAVGAGGAAAALTLSATAAAFWPRGLTVSRVQGTALSFTCTARGCGQRTNKMMSWCPSCGMLRPDSWVCRECQMASMGSDDYCRFRVHGGCPGTRSTGRVVGPKQQDKDTLRIELMQRTRSTSGMVNALATEAAPPNE